MGECAYATKQFRIGEEREWVVAFDRLVELPVQLWSYWWDDETVRHLGPMLDANGVCMAAIQALQERVAALEAKVAEL